MNSAIATPAIATPAIATKDLSVTVGKTTLLEPVSLSVETGTWLSIIGPNGAGKSTLLRSIIGATQSTGSVHINGSDRATMKRTERARQLAWVPQSPTIPTGFTVLDYVLLGRTPHRGPLAAERPEDLAIVDRVLNDLDLVSLAERTVTSLSGGERQRVVIARALAQEAPIVLLDEPTTALDLGHQQEVLHLLDQLRSGGRTIITTMHDLTLAGQFADRLILLAGARIVADGDAVTVLTEENLATHYQADVTVMHQDGAVIVLPRIANPEDNSNGN